MAATSPHLTLDPGTDAPEGPPARRRREAHGSPDAHPEVAVLAARLSSASREELSVLVGELERLRALAWSHLVSAEPRANASGTDENLSVEEAARRLGVSPDWLYRAKLPFKVKIGRRVLFSAQGLAKWNRQRCGQR